MRCERLQELLPRYLDGDLRGVLNQQISDHLDLCESCRRELSAEQQALRALDAGRHSVSIDLWPDFSRRLQAHSPAHRPRWRLLWQPGLVVATAAAAVAIIGGFATRPGPGLPRHSPDLGAVSLAQTPMPAESAETPAHSPAEQSRLSLPTSTKSGPMSFRSTRSRPVQAAREQRPTGISSHSRRLRRTGHHLSVIPAAHIRLQPEVHPVLLAKAPSVPTLETHLDARSPVGPSADRTIDVRQRGPSRVDQALPVDASQRPDADHRRTGDPLQVAVALASVEQDTASDQMGGELLRMAREVTRLSGEAGGVPPPGTETSGRDSALQMGDTPAGT